MEALRQLETLSGRTAAMTGQQTDRMTRDDGWRLLSIGRHLERLPSLAQDDLHLPDARFGLYGWALINDHQTGTSQLLFHPSLDAAFKEQ